MTDFALAGAGWISAVHGLAVNALPGGQMVAVASRTAASAQARAAEIGGAVVAYEDLPAGADIVIVATPPAHHAIDALRAMAAGAAVVVEKPLCTTLDDADRLVRVVEAGGTLTYGENLLFAEPVSLALSEIATLGPLTHLSARAMAPRPNWGSYLERAWGGGTFFDLGVRPLALVLRAAGAAHPVGVRASFAASKDLDVEDRASVEVRFDTGLVASIEVSWREQEPVWDLQAASTEGVVVLELLPDVALERSGEPIDIGAGTVGDGGAGGDRAESDREDGDSDREDGDREQGVRKDGVGYPPQLDQFGYIDQLRDAESAWRAGHSGTISDARFGRQLLEIVCAASLAAAAATETPLPYLGPRDRAPIELWRPTP